MLSGASGKCKHDKPFKFLTKPERLWIGITEGGELPGSWHCPYLCGFFLPFDPEDPKFPEGIVYTEEPKEGLKEIKLSEGGKY